MVDFSTVSGSVFLKCPTKDRVFKKGKIIPSREVISTNQLTVNNAMSVHQLGELMLFMIKF